MTSRGQANSEALRRNLLSRRPLLRAMLGTSIAGVLAACGGDDDDGDDGEEVSTSASQENGNPTSTTRTIEHALGSADVPATPKRIIALDPYVTLPTALAVDAPVIATCQIPYDEPFPVFVDPAKTEGLEDVGWLPELDLEKMVELEPDLIVGQLSFVEDSYDQLSAIAPTVAIATEEDEGAHRRNWKAVVRDVAAVLSADEGIEALIGAYEERVAELQELLGEHLDSMEVSLANLRAPDDIRIYTVDSCAGQTLEEVGFSRPDGQGPVEGGINIRLSTERLREIDADILFYFVGSAATNPEDARKQSEQIISNPLWDQLNAVQNDEVHEVDKRWWFSCGSVQAANRILDDLFDVFDDGSAMTGG